MFQDKLRKTPILLIYMSINFVLIGVDVALAHSQNNFFRFEMIPLIYTPFAVAAILLKLLLPGKRWVNRILEMSLGFGVLIGVIGTLFHLAGNAISNSQPIYEVMIEGSPVAAPIAFAGIDIYTWVAVKPVTTRRDSWLLILVGLGFLASVLAAFLDHARLTFSPIYTLFPIISGLMATIGCFWLAFSQKSRSEVLVFLNVMALNMLIGLLGFVFHVLGDLAGTQTIIWARFLYRNPILGPLLFCDLAVLGGLSLLPELISHHKIRLLNRR